MARTIPQTALDANELFEELTTGIVLDLDLPALIVNTDFEMPAETGPAYDVIPPLTIDDLTTKVVDGTGSFDALMSAASAHLSDQFEKGRLTGADYAKVYLGAMTQVMQTGLSFLMNRDKSTLEILALQEAVKLAQAQRIRAVADIEIARMQIQQGQYITAKLRLEAIEAFNRVALSKMALVTAYDDSLVKEAQVALTNEQVDTARAQTKDTLLGGGPLAGFAAKDLELKDAQALTAREQLDTARASTKDTLLDGGPISGLVAIEKAFKEAQQVQMEHQGQLTLEQVETQRAQTRDTLTTGQNVSGILGVEKTIKLAQKALTEEQVETQRAQTWDTHVNGTPILGIMKYEKDLKSAQAKYVLEQYETQRGQTRGTLSTGETVIGLVGAQTRLYEQQIISYKRDAESKGVKMLLDTWTARKTIDEGVAVPAAIDGASLNSAIVTYRANLDLD